MEQRSVQGGNDIGWEGHSSVQGGKRLDELKGKRDSLKYPKRDFKKSCLT